MPLTSPSEFPTVTRPQQARLFLPLKYSSGVVARSRTSRCPRYGKPCLATSTAKASASSEYRRGYLRAKAASLLLLLPAALGLARVASGVVAALQTGCISGLNTLLSGIVASDTSDGTPAAVSGLDAEATDLAGPASGSASDNLSAEALTDEDLCGDLADQLEDLLGGLPGADVDPEQLLRALLLSVASGSHDPWQLSQLGTLYLWLVGAQLTAAACKWLLGLAVALDPVKNWLLLSERKLHLGLGAALLRGLAFVLPSMVLPLRLPWMRSLAIMLQREGTINCLRRWRPGRAGEQQKKTDPGAGGVEQDGSTPEPCSSALMLTCSGEGALSRRDGLESQEQRLHVTTCSTTASRTANTRPNLQGGQGRFAEGGLPRCCTSVSVFVTSGPSASTSLPGHDHITSEWRDASSLADSAASTSRTHVGGWKALHALHGTAPGSSRLAINVLRVAALLGNSVAAVILPSNRPAPWPVKTADFLAAAATSAAALVAFAEVWRLNDRGFLFTNDAERAIKLGQMMLIMRGGIEIAAAVYSGRWGLACYCCCLCFGAWLNCGATDTEPDKAYYHLWCTFAPVLATIAYIKEVL